MTGYVSPGKRSIGGNRPDFSGPLGKDLAALILPEHVLARSEIISRRELSVSGVALEGSVEGPVIGFSSGYIRDTGISLGPYPLTIAARVQLGTFADRRLAHVTDGTTLNCILGVQITAGGVRAQFYNGAEVITDYLPTVAGEWATIVLRVSSVGMSITGSGTTHSTLFTPTGTPNRLCIGNPDWGSGEYFDGKVSWLAAWRRVLDDREVDALTLGRRAERLLRRAPVYFLPSAGGGGATITGDSGSYTLTGTAATLKAGRKLAADSGTYNLTGTAAALKVGRKLTADSGTYTLTGTAVAFKRGYALGAESGTYTVSGTSVNLKAGRKLTADSGSYALTGTDVTLNYSPAGSYNLTAESGTYTLTGTAATLKVSRKLTADSGTYALTGTAAGLAKGVRLTAESGSYTLTGSNVAFARTYVLTAESGAYTLTGTSAGLTWSGAPVVEVPTNGGPSIYGKPVFREKQFRKEYEEQVKRIEDEKRLARILREDEEIICIMALMAA